jgi:DNA-binding NtrC family response regulator
MEKANFRILVVDDEPIARDNLEHILRREGYEVVTAASGQQALKLIEAQQLDLVLTDLKMERIDGMEVLEKTKARHPEIEVIMITGYATISSAIESLKKGAYHYVAKPFNLEEVRSAVRRALERKRLRDEARELKTLVKQDVPFLIGKSQKIQEITRLIKQVAPSESNVLVSGESGTGKELVARMIHHFSRRARGRFVAINCGAFTEELLANELFGHEKDAFTGATSTKAGLLEAAAGGTVLLDEVGDMPLAMQVKLMRVIQERELLRVGGTKPIPLDVRFIAATNKDLKRSVEEGSFRQDLYYRLNVVSIRMPPLAERKEDIPLLACYFLDRYASAAGKQIEEISEEARELLVAYDYPGNVRELENIIERAVALEEERAILAKDLPPDLQQLVIQTFRRDGQLLSLEEREKEYVKWVLHQVDGNKTKAAEMLGINRVSLWRKLKRYGLAD